MDHPGLLVLLYGAGCVFATFVLWTDTEFLGVRNSRFKAAAYFITLISLPFLYRMVDSDKSNWTTDWQSASWSSLFFACLWAVGAVFPITYVSLILLNILTYPIRQFVVALISFWRRVRERRENARDAHRRQIEWKEREAKIINEARTREATQAAEAEACRARDRVRASICFMLEKQFDRVRLKLPQTFNAQWLAERIEKYFSRDLDDKTLLDRCTDMMDLMTELSGGESPNTVSAVRAKYDAIRADLEKTQLDAITRDFYLSQLAAAESQAIGEILERA